MILSFFSQALIVALCGGNLVRAQLHPELPAQYRPLPLLRQRASIQDNWTVSRIANIPSLLRKYHAQAWLVR
jgi:hypothetical protein